MNSHFNGILSALSSGFRQGYSTQHALFCATETWKRCLDTNGIAGTTLITKTFGGKKFGEKTSAKKISLKFFDISVKYFGQIVYSKNEFSIHFTK